MIILSNISKAYGPKTLFSDVSLRLLRGEKLGLVGPNGAGKTTLFSIILGELEEDSGKVELERGKTIGCFYIESPAMRMLLTKLGADDYLGLVAASSIIRPGVSKSGMMREYILRHRDKTRRQEAKSEIPELYELMEDTYGVMVYQEDVIKVAHCFAGLTLAEADILRRGMSWSLRQKSDFHSVRDRFFSNCQKRGYSSTVISRIWNQKKCN